MFETIKAEIIYKKLYLENTSEAEKERIYNKLIKSKNKEKIIFEINCCYLKNKIAFKIEFLEKDYYITELLKYLLKEETQEQILNYILSDRVTEKNKVYLLNNLLEDSYIEKILQSSEFSDNVKEIVIKKNNIKPFYIYVMLTSYGIEDKYKKYIFDNLITEENVIECLYEMSRVEEESNKVYKKFKKYIDKYILSIKKKELLKKITSIYGLPDKLKNMIIDKRKKDLIKIINNSDRYTLYICCSSNIPKLIELTLEVARKKVLRTFKRITKSELLNLMNGSLPIDIKEYIFNNNEQVINKYVNNLKEKDIRDGYNVYGQIINGPRELNLKIFNKHKETIIKLIKEKEINSIRYGIKDNKYIEELIDLMITTKINDENIISVLNDYYYDIEFIDIIMKHSKKSIINLIDKITYEEIKKYTSINLYNKIINAIVNNYPDYVRKKLETLKESEKEGLLLGYNLNFEIKKQILKCYNIEEEDLEAIIDLLNITYNVDVINQYDKIKKFFTLINIDFNLFIQYGCGNIKYKNWLNNILNIMNKDIKKFIKIKEYLFKNYYKITSKVSLINSILELIDNYNKYEILLNYLANNNIRLNKKIKNDLSNLFELNMFGEIINPPKNLEELSKFKSVIYKKYLEMIEDPNIDIKELRSMLKKLLLSNNTSTMIDNIGGINSLEILKLNNKNNTVICNLIDEIISNISIIYDIERTENINGLKELIKKIIGSNEQDLLNVITEFNNMEEKIRKVFELDSENNLTKINSIDDKECIIDKKLSNSYGGIVYDFSDKNYVLYAHIKSYRESVEDLVNGKSTSKSNFISLSPISYKGQKYYYNHDKLIFAYDTIPENSFIYSSTHNMGSNEMVMENSTVVKMSKLNQKGILETSSVTNNNSETLLFREGLKPCGLILANGKEPTEEEIEIHKKYNLPFIITQEIEKFIENPKEVFKKNTIKVEKEKEKLLTIKNSLQKYISYTKENEIYTGREIAIMTDIHGMYEPTVAILESIKKRGITEIYSLGDNVGLGPNPADVEDILNDYGCKTIAGNAEYYNTIGIEPFPYFDNEKIENQEWTLDKLGTKRIENMKLYPASKDIIVGNKKVVLCHFINDIRWDFRKNSTWSYQSTKDPKQFLYTNSIDANKDIENALSLGITKENYGYLDAKDKPIFDGKSVNDYEYVFQGHVHFDMSDKLNNTYIYTVRAAGMGYKDADKNMAHYIILKEKKDGTFDIEKEYINYNKKSLISNISSSSIPHKEKVLRFLN